MFFIIILLLFYKLSSMVLENYSFILFYILNSVSSQFLFLGFFKNIGSLFCTVNKCLVDTILQLGKETGNTYKCSGFVE